MTIDHCDLINEALTTEVSSPGAVRALVAVDASGTQIANVNVTNSIVYGAAGLVGFGAGVYNATDCNVYSPDGVPNAGFTFTNVVQEWPVFESVSSNLNDPTNFLVSFGTASATLGTTPPIGALYGVGTGPVNESRHWTQFE